MTASRRQFLQTVAAGAAAATALPDSATAADTKPGEFTYTWLEAPDRVWTGPDFWANRLQDWRVSRGRLECVESRPAWPVRTLHLLTRSIAAKEGEFLLKVRTGCVNEEGVLAADAATGFLVGVGPGMDYRSRALVQSVPGAGGGFFAGRETSGELFIRDFEKDTARPARPDVKTRDAVIDVVLKLTAKPEGGKYTLTLAAHDGKTDKELKTTSLKDIDPARLAGGVAVVSHPGSGPNTVRFWFRSLHLSGTKVEVHEDRTFGPVVCTQYTVQNGVLKLTAQLTPVGDKDPDSLTLQLKQEGGWKDAATTKIVKPGYTATFRVEKWDSTKEVHYRVGYSCKPEDKVIFYRSGVIKKDPVEKKSITLATLCCVQQIQGGFANAKTYPWAKNVYFPHADLIPNVAKQEPDLLFFAGDQIYEGNPTRVVRAPVEEALLDYLYKWYLWCWTYRDLVASIPTITIPDDHDVYQGNVWGDGGKASAKDDPGGLLGGYGMPAEWLNMMQRTQCAHLPDPFDATPAAQDISVYYTALVWGQVGFAVLEDRKFKSSPSIVKVKMTPDSHILEEDFDTHKADLPGATLLGERQHKFLREFCQDWKGQVMKAALSQTIFCNLQISSRGPLSGKIDRDLDSNGWPQTPRNQALREMRKGFLVHIAGDQHLASVVRHGVDDFDDSIWSLCAPAVSNLYTRYWNPKYKPLDWKPGKTQFMGQFEDGFWNKITVHAVANPVDNPAQSQFPEPVELHRKAPGYAIARFNKEARTITFEVWPRYVDPTDAKSGTQYAGWPVTVKQLDNYTPKPGAVLPTLQVTGQTDPVVQVLDAKNEVVFTVRIQGTTFEPRVPREGTYTVKVGEPGTDKVKTLAEVATVPKGETKTLKVEF